MTAKILQHWNGVVEQRLEDSLWVRWTDVTDPSQDEALSELQVSSLDETDTDAVMAGTRLEWKIQAGEGSFKPFSRIRVLPKEHWTSEDIRAMEAKAQGLLERFRVDG